MSATLLQSKAAGILMAMHKSGFIPLPNPQAQQQQPQQAPAQPDPNAAAQAQQPQQAAPPQQQAPQPEPQPQQDPNAAAAQAAQTAQQQAPAAPDNSGQLEQVLASLTKGMSELTGVVEKGHAELQAAMTEIARQKKEISEMRMSMMMLEKQLASMPPPAAAPAPR